MKYMFTRVRGRSARRGMALATSLFLVVFLLVLGISYLSMVQSDLNYINQQERMMRSYYLARAGLDYYIQKNYVPTLGGIQTNPQLGPQTAPPYGPVTVAPNEYFSLQIQPNMQVKDPKTGLNTNFDMVISTGYITNSLGKVLARRVLMAPKVGPMLPPFTNFQTGTTSADTGTDHMGLDRGRIYDIYDTSL
jgi:hypothetical protein